MFAVVKFRCPECKRIFEFDSIGECNLVSCPVCGNEFKTVKKGPTLTLEPSEFNSESETDLESFYINWNVNQNKMSAMDPENAVP